MSEHKSNPQVRDHKFSDKQIAERDLLKKVQANKGKLAPAKISRQVSRQLIRSQNKLAAQVERAEIAKIDYATRQKRKKANMEGLGL